MLAEQMGVRAICRAAHCDARTVKAVEQEEAESITTQKKRIAGTTARVARMSIERIEEEIPNMPINLLGMTFGIAVDKLNTLTGDPNQRIEVNVQHNHQGNIFERLNNLADQISATVREKMVQAKVIEAEPLQIQGQ